MKKNILISLFLIAISCHLQAWEGEKGNGGLTIKCNGVEELVDFYEVGALPGLKKRFKIVKNSKLDVAEQEVYLKVLDSLVQDFLLEGLIHLKIEFLKWIKFISLYLISIGRMIL